MTRLACWVGRHDDLRHVAEHRVCLRCQACGRETPGWRDDELPRPILRPEWEKADPRFVVQTHTAAGKLTRGAARVFRLMKREA